MKLICDPLSESYSIELVWVHRPSVKGEEEMVVEKWVKSLANETREQCSIKLVENSLSTNVKCKSRKTGQLIFLGLERMVGYPFEVKCEPPETVVSP